MYSGLRIPRGFVRAFAPATISNLGPGFDVLGLAINQPGDYVLARKQRTPGLLFSVRSSCGEVPTDPHQNVAAYVATLMLEEFRPPFGMEMILLKRMPVGSGLGSSAASSVASAVAVREMLGKKLRKTDLLPFVVEGERKACGAPHADNAAPSLLGGMCLIRSDVPLDVVRIPIRTPLFWVVAHPHVVVRTENARNILPSNVPLHTARRQWAHVGGLTLGFATGNAMLIGKCIEDFIIEPARARLVPGFDQVKQAAMSAGALGCSLSGSGPSVFAVTTSRDCAQRAGAAMRRAFFQHAGVRSDVFVSTVNARGAYAERGENS